MLVEVLTSMCEEHANFSRRHGFKKPAREITIREDAPREFRGAVIQIASRAGLQPKALRRIVCEVVHRLPNQENWSHDPVFQETAELVMECDWFRVFDIIEAIDAQLVISGRCDDFRQAINDSLAEHGIGWQLVNGRVEHRGTAAFEAGTAAVVEVCDKAELPTAKHEIEESLSDLSRRPIPDLTGAIQHAMAALECVARKACGDPKATLGQILSQHPNIVPKPLDEAVRKIWGYASEKGRHLRKGRMPSHEEAELVVGLSATIATYLARKLVPDG